MSAREGGGSAAGDSCAGGAQAGAEQRRSLVEGARRLVTGHTCEERARRQPSGTKVCTRNCPQARKEVKKLSFLPGALARLAGLAARRCVLFAVFSSLPLGWVLGWPTSCGDPHRWQSCTQPSCHFLGWASDIIRSSNQNLTCLINKKKKSSPHNKGCAQFRKRLRAYSVAHERRWQ